MGLQVDGGRRQAKTGSAATWQSLWRFLSEIDRKIAINRYLELHGDPLPASLAKAISSRTNVRVQTLQGWPRKRLAAFLLKHAEAALQPFWADFFDCNFSTSPEVFEIIAATLNTSLDLLPDDDDEETPRTAIPVPPSALSPEAADAAVKHLRDRVDGAFFEQAIYYLRVADERWEPLGRALDRAIAVPVEAPLPPVAKDPLLALTDFTTIDRVVIEHIVGTSSNAEAALSAEQIDDLVNTLIALNPMRKRSYFTLGLADVIIEDRDVDFERTEFDDERRSWYLVGVLLGLLRQRRKTEVIALLSDKAEAFRVAAKHPGAGAALARSTLKGLVEFGRVGEAVQLVSAQLGGGGLELAETTLELAIGLLRENAVQEAWALLRPLWERHATPTGDSSTAPWTRYRRSLKRRVAQVLQAQADYEAADALLAELCTEGTDEERARVYADRGLVAARVPGVFALALPDTDEARQLRVQALGAGAQWFNESQNLAPASVVSALYALGQLSFLQWRRGGEKDASLRNDAIAWLQGAVTQMRLADAAPAYERTGLLGQALFMLTVVILHRLGPTDILTAAEQWRQISGSAGRFPDDDVSLLLEIADVASDDHATMFAESVWTHRKADALAVVLQPARLERSSLLRRELQAMAIDTATPKQTQRKIWMTLIPVLLRLREQDAAEAGLDALEAGADQDAGLREVMQFFSTASNYEPVWRETDALWSQVRLARKLGDDDAAAQYLRTLFYRMRDSTLEDAAQIVDLAATWQMSTLAGQLRAALPIAAPVAEEADEQARLKAGESVAVVFVGGNEIQEQYDARLARRLSELYPGLRVSFRHTGWSSNWGQLLPALVRECNAADAVALMPMIRTMLGRRLREQLQRPWVSCVAHGEKGMERAIVHAARVALRRRGQAG